MFRIAIILAVLWVFLIISTAHVAVAAENDDAAQDPLPEQALARFGSLRVWAGEISGVAFSPDGKILAAGMGKAVQLWDMATGKRLQRLEGTQPVQALAFAPHGKILATCGEGEYKEFPSRNPQFKSLSIQTGAVIWDMQTAKLVRELDDGGRSLAFSPDGKRLAFANWVDEWWDTNSWKEVPLVGGKNIGELGGQISSVAISPDGQSFAVASFGRRVHVLNMKTQQSQRIPAELTNCPFVTFTSDSKALLTAGGDTLRMWDLATGKDRKPFGDISADDIAVAAKGTRVAWRSWGGIYVGDLASGKMSKPLRGHRAGVTCLALSPDGKTLATGSRDGTVLLWDASGQELLAPDDVAATRVAARAEPTPVPADAKVYLNFKKKEFLLGENILAEFVVHNTGTQLWNISLGGDYRGAARHLRYHVTATDENGNAVADPNPSSFCMGGIGHSPEVQPGKKYSQDLPILSYLNFEKPGTYTIRVSHDLGWTAANGLKHPVAEATIRLVRPMAEQAKQLVDDLYTRDRPDADFRVLRHPLYLPTLAMRAEQKCNKALAGISGIATAEATRVLIKLAENSNGQFALGVVQILNERLPDPQIEGKLPARNLFVNDRLETRRQLAERAWRAELGPAVRKLAHKLLLKKDVTSLQCGGYILECLGEKDDVPMLARALDAAVAQARDLPLETHVYPRPRGACMELLRAANVIMQRGIDPPANPGSPGEHILFAQAIHQRTKFRPAGWQQAYARVLQDDYPFVRKVGLDCLPDIADKLLVGQVPKLLMDADTDVQIAACHAVGRLRAAELREPLLKVLGTAKEHWLLLAASNAAYEFVPRLQRLKVFVKRLDEHDMTHVCLSHLTSVVNGYSGMSGPGKLSKEEARQCKDVWEQFIGAHEQPLRDGRAFDVSDPSIPVAELFPRTKFYTSK